MTAPLPRAHPAAPATGQVLYHVVHPTDPDRDEWTQHYPQARALYERFAWAYGQTHLHVETFHAGQYEAACLLRTNRARCIRQAGRAAMSGRQG